MKKYEYKTIESTQDIALKKNYECVIVADNQTKGRGRFDRKWESLEGNLLTSIVIKASVEEIFKIVMSVSVAIVDAIGCGKIKWPNDVLINNKKVCGVLIEQGQEGLYVVGIGLNIIKSPNLLGLIYPATSLKEEGVLITRDDALNKIVKNLLSNMKDENLFEKYYSHLYGIGKKCKINDICGILKEVDKNGYLLIETENKKTTKVFAGDLFFA